MESSHVFIVIPLCVARVMLDFIKTLDSNFIPTDWYFFIAADCTKKRHKAKRILCDLEKE